MVDSARDMFEEMVKLPWHRINARFVCCPYVANGLRSAFLFILEQGELKE
jgi:hypothetical protein